MGNLFIGNYIPQIFSLKEKKILVTAHNQNLVAWKWKLVEKWIYGKWVYSDFIVTKLIPVNILHQLFFKWIHDAKYPERFMDVQDKFKPSPAKEKRFVRLRKCIQRIDSMNHGEPLWVGHRRWCIVCHHLIYSMFILVMISVKWN